MHVVRRNLTGAPRLSSALQPLAKARHVRTRQSAQAAPVQHQTEECCEFGSRDDVRLAGMQGQPPSLQPLRDASLPFGKLRRAVAEGRKVDRVTQAGLLHDILGDVVQPVQGDVGEQLAGQVTQRQVARAQLRRELVVARKLTQDGLLRVRDIDNEVAQRQGGAPRDRGAVWPRPPRSWRRHSAASRAPKAAAPAFPRLPRTAPRAAAHLPAKSAKQAGGMFKSLEIQQLQVLGQAHPEARLLEAEIAMVRQCCPVAGLRGFDEGARHFESAGLQAIAEPELLPPRQAVEHRYEPQHELLVSCPADT
jgi:hypothetical protein